MKNNSLTKNPSCLVISTRFSTGVEIFKILGGGELMERYILGTRRKVVHGTPCIYLSPALPPPPFQLGARSGGGRIGNVALRWRRITFINLTLPRIHARSMHARGRTCMEPFAYILHVAIARVVNDSFCVREQSGDTCCARNLRLPF